MPFAALAIPAAISAGSAIYGAVKGSRSNQEKAAQNTASGIGNLGIEAQKQLAGMGTDVYGRGTNLFGTGAGNTAAGTDYLRTILRGNAADTAAAMAPDVNRIRAANQNAVQSISTIMPRGAGREGTLFSASYAPTSQIQNLFNTTRMQAAPALAAVGMQQQGLANNLFQTGGGLYGVGNQALNTGLNAQDALLKYGLSNRQLMNLLYGQAGSALTSLGGSFFKPNT